jgi:isopenicillin N synthase-like dioxygenase
MPRLGLIHGKSMHYCLHSTWMRIKVDN